MTDFVRTDEQRMLAETLDARLSGGALPWAAAIEETGLSLLGTAEDAGGLGTDARDAAVVAAALGRGNAALPWAGHWVAARAGTPDWSDDAHALLHSAELVGLCRTLIADTAAFLKERRQFGVAIATFQSLRHRMADMAMALELAAASTDLAIDALDGPGDTRPAAISAARVLAEEAGRIVGEGAVQLHGAMGLTAELRVGGYFRRVRALMQCDGTARAHLRRYAAT